MTDPVEPSQNEDDGPDHRFGQSGQTSGESQKFSEPFPTDASSGDQKPPASGRNDDQGQDDKPSKNNNILIDNSSRFIYGDALSREQGDAWRQVPSRKTLQKCLVKYHPEPHAEWPDNFHDKYHKILDKGKFLIISSSNQDGRLGLATHLLVNTNSLFLVNIEYNEEQNYSMKDFFNLDYKQEKNVPTSVGLIIDCTTSGAGSFLGKLQLGNKTYQKMISEGLKHNQLYVVCLTDPVQWKQYYKNVNPIFAEVYHLEAELKYNIGVNRSNVENNAIKSNTDQSKPPKKPKSEPIDYDRPRLECIVAIDICRSTEILHMYGNHYYRILFSEFKTMVEQIVTAFSCQEVKDNGDGLLWAFVQSKDAVQAMCQLLHRLQIRNASVDVSRQVNIRVGMDFGETLLKKEDPRDRSGATVVKATRIEGLKDTDFSPLQRVSLPLENRLLVSHKVFKSLPSSISCVNLGFCALKGFEGQMEEIFQVNWQS